MLMNRVLSIALLLLPVAVTADATPPHDSPRTLLIALDAVPYESVVAVANPENGEPPIFRNFRGPIPLVSTFPSTTSLALGGILGGVGLEQSPGYEHRFYDRERHEKRGGGLFSYRKLLFPWRKFFDWQEHGLISKGFKLFKLEKASRNAIDDALSTFLASDKETFYAYFDLTDMIAHIHGPEGLHPFLRLLDEALLRLRADHPELPLTVVIYSDHGVGGGEPLLNVRKNVYQALRAAGFHRTQKVGERSAVVFVPYGLVSSFVAFTRDGEQSEVARAISGARGIDFCVADDGDSYKILSRRGVARVMRRSRPTGDLYGYRALRGDPLDFEALAQGPGPEGEPTPWRPDRWWFDATRDHIYPDALYRVARAFDLVHNPASVVCSLETGYMYGAGYTALASRLSPFSRLRFTHGAMARGDSLGFTMSDDPGWMPPEAVRFDEALTPWAEK